MFWKILRFIFPRQCFSCENDLRLFSWEKPICGNCLTQIHFKPTRVPQFSSSLDLFYAPFKFEGVLRDLIHGFKYRRKIYLASFLARILKEHLPDFSYVDFIYPVPSSSWVELFRGYSQTKLISEKMSVSLERPILAGNIKKRIFSPSQTKLNRKQRKKNAASSLYISKRKVFPDLRGKVILIIDDVLTTGATMNRCAELLKAEGVKKVIGVALAFEELKG